jgi:hypothetical protein
MAVTNERIRSWLVRILAVVVIVVACVAAYLNHLGTGSASTEARIWAALAATPGLICGLVLIVSSPASGSRLTEFIYWFVVVTMVVAGAAMVLEPLGIPAEVTACAGVGVFLLCISLARPMLVKTGWWKKVIWSGVGASWLLRILAIVEMILAGVVYASAPDPLSRAAGKTTLALELAIPLAGLGLIGG